MSTINPGAIPTQTMKFTEARPQLSELLNRVYNRETRVKVTKGSIPVAAIISVEDLERLEQMDLEREEDFRAFERISAAFADVPPEEFEREIDRIAAEVRAEMRAERDAASGR